MNGLPTLLLYCSISEQVFTEATFEFFVRDVQVPEPKVHQVYRRRGSNAPMLHEQATIQEGGSETGQRADSSSSTRPREQIPTERNEVQVAVEIHPGNRYSRMIINQMSVFGMISIL